MGSAAAPSRVAAVTPASTAAPWWRRPDLDYAAGVLHLGGEDLAALAGSLGSPLFAYSAPRIRANLMRLRGALDSAALDYRVFYAMKSNRYAPLLTFLRTLGHCGIDACSPGEVGLARQVGFDASAISFTGTSLADRDLDRLLGFPGLVINCDSLSSLRRLGERAPGRAVGLRVNPAVGLGYQDNELLRYAGSRPTKFGIYRSAFEEALAVAARYDLRVTGLHLHAGCGYLTPQLDAWQAVLDALLWFADRAPALEYINTGGGLGIPLVESDPILDLDRWSGILADRLGGRGVQVWVEPGDYIVKDAGVLVLQVTTVEHREGVRFIGLDGGWNIHMEPAFYGLPLEIVPVREPAAGAPLERATVVGNINEALDVWAHDILLPDIREGDFLALLNAGGYGTAMASNHCMRGDYTECLVGSVQP